MRPEPAPGRLTRKTSPTPANPNSSVHSSSTRSDSIAIEAIARRGRGVLINASGAQNSHRHETSHSACGVAIGWSDTDGARATTL